jgi:uncharacterized C2H2 Zn-finger protein
MALTEERTDFTCPRCDAVFGSEKDLESHIQSHVTNRVGASHVCTECGAAFETEGELHGHVARHESVLRAA